MAITEIGHGSHRYIGLSTDIKPTAVTYGSKQGATFFEYDTSKLFITHDGTTWVEKLPLLQDSAGNAIGSDVADAGTIPTTFRGLGTMAVLYGFDGTTNSALRVLNSTYPYLKVALYGADANQCKLTRFNADNTSATDYGLNVASRLFGYDGTTWDRIHVSASGSIMTNEEASETTTSGKLTVSTKLGGNNQHIYAVTITAGSTAPCTVEVYDGVDDTGVWRWGVKIPKNGVLCKNFKPWLILTNGCFVKISGNPYAVVVEYGI